MSGWDQYITNLTAQGITHAGIFGIDGSCWAASANFPVRLFSIIVMFIYILCIVFRQSKILKTHCRKLSLQSHLAL